MSEFVLPNRRVFVKPIIKKGKWLSEEHSGNFMYDNTKMIITVPLSAQTGELIDPLTKEERDYFESKEASGLDFAKGDLSTYKKTNYQQGVYNYWHTYEYRLKKDQSIVDNQTTLDILDLSKPMDYIKYKVLLSNSGNGGLVAASWDDRFEQGTYKIALVDSEYEEESKASKLDKLGEAYAFAKKISKSHTKMYEFLSVYWLENRDGNKPSLDSTVDWLKAEISKIIDKNVDAFLDTINSNYEEKLIIHNGMKCGAISRPGHTFVLADGTPIGSSVAEAILYFKDERHNEEKLRLIAQIEVNSKS
jgi:hypothetical protein